MKKIKESIEIGGRELTIETGLLAKQASGSVLITYGETIALVTATSSKGHEDDRGFFPMSVEYREKFYASGKIPGGFFKREARPSEREILAARLTDRPLRPLFPKGFNNETGIVINVLSYDGQNEPDILGTIGASAALHISDIPWDGPVASVRMGKVDGELVVNPTSEEMLNSKFDVVVSGTSDSIVMVEGGCDFVTESELVECIEEAHKVIKQLISMQNKLAESVGISKREVVQPVSDQELIDAIDNLINDDYKSLNSAKDKDSRYEDIRIYLEKVCTELEESFPDSSSAIKSYVNDKINSHLREETMKGNRADGRSLDKVRDINIELSVLPRTHGSSVFTRGETQALVVTTLGGKSDEQMLDSILGKEYKNNMLHYNFPSFCVGEARMKFSLSRREVGHGNLAERALRYALPDFEEFPYTTRVVSEILESNGSSSMASVCGGSLALMDAGVPIKAPIAGVAMGLMVDDDGNSAIITDILGTEDHIGDMDFKVAGSADGITAIQMDLKIDGLSYELLSEALEAARKARLHILEEMSKAISEPREKLSSHAPKIYQAKLPVDKIGEFIGPGGKNIKKAMELYDCEINIDDDGSCTVLGNNQELLEEALGYVKSYSLVPKVGESYTGEVVKILDFGAFVKIAPSVEGLVHISEVDWKRTENMFDALKEGQTVDVKLIKIDSATKKISFSIKALKPKPEFKD